MIKKRQHLMVITDELWAWGLHYALNPATKFREVLHAAMVADKALDQGLTSGWHSEPIKMAPVDDTQAETGNGHPKDTYGPVILSKRAGVCSGTYESFPIGTPICQKNGRPYLAKWVLAQESKS